MQHSIGIVETLTKDISSEPTSINDPAIYIMLNLAIDNIKDNIKDIQHFIALGA